MNNLALTCKAAFEALGSREMRVLEAENSMLSAALFNATMPDFIEVVRNFNDARGGPQCNCDECHYLMLVREAWCAQDTHRCALWPAWDAMLERLGVSVDHGTDEEYIRVCPLLPRCPDFQSENKTLQLHVTQYGLKTIDSRDSAAAVVKKHDQWTARMHVVGSWGRPVTSMQDPRIAEWHRIFHAIEQLDGDEFRGL